MSDSYIELFCLSLEIVFICILVKLRSLSYGLTKQVAFALLLGLLLGFSIQFLYKFNVQDIASMLAWIRLPGEIYTALLKMIIMPLVLVTIINAVLRLQLVSSLGRIGFSVISVLMITTAIAAVIGIAVVQIFGLNAEGLLQGEREISELRELEIDSKIITNLDLPNLLVSFVPTNIFSDLSGSRETSVIGVVIFSIFFGLSALLVHKEQPLLGLRIKQGMEAIQAVVMQLVKLVVSLSPFGILSLIAYVVASSSAQDIYKLFLFVVASYVAIFIMFMVHALLLAVNGYNPLSYFKKVWPVLSFAFATRSSVATIPLNVSTQIEQLNVPELVASISASLGSTIGQNGCAGLYPAMLAVMVAPTVGQDPSSLGFILSLIGIVCLSSFGVAGVGGGATFAALIVLPAMGLPVSLVALLISVEALIDMGRTSLNVSGSMLSGVISARFTRE
jgi:L-cystine uptake protein TcyP (sodium:dicarboxylate symporter family)